MVKGQSTRGTQCSIRGAIMLALLALPSVAVAQNGDGFLFQRPKGSFVMRVGYEAARPASESFDFLEGETTLGPRSFDAINLGADLNFFLTRSIDLTFTLDVTSRTNTSEYREWEENGQPITHESTLERAMLGGGFRYNLLPRGRQISSLAYIPARTVPYIGATGGIMWYDFRQKGDFVEVVDDSTGNIFTDELKASHYTLMGQAFAGIEQRLNARWSLVGEARYTQAHDRLNNDFAELGNLSLSGLAFNLGATVRF
jgi:hypothetical protein